MMGARRPERRSGPGLRRLGARPPRGALWKPTAPLLEMQGISKRFPGVQALSGVDFRLFPGEVHALMGQNGAGKSTLIKVLTGVHPADAGPDRAGGAGDRARAARQDAQDLGISTVYQEVNLCPNLSVAENIFLGRGQTGTYAHRLAQHAPAGGGAAGRRAQHPHRRHRRPLRLLHRHPADGRHRAIAVACRPGS